MNEKNKIGIKGIIGFTSWFFITQYCETPLTWLGIDVKTISKLFLEIYTILAEIISILIIYILFNKEIKSMWKDFFKNRDIYFKKYFKYWFLILGLMAITNGIIISINSSSTAKNQEAINSMFERLPIYTYIVSVLFAPVIEELVFRLCLKKVFTEKYLYIILSGCVFGLFHVLGTFETAFDFIYVIPYSIPGIVFASIMYDSDNIFNSMWLHFVHNGMAMFITIIALFM